METKTLDILWDDNPIDVTADANFIWSIANKLRGSYMPDKYGDVIIPMTIIRRFECALNDTKEAVVNAFEEKADIPEKKLKKISGYQFYNTSKYTLKELCNDSENIASNFESYLKGFSPNVQDILKQLKMEEQITKMDEEGCLYSVVKAFSEQDLSPERYDSIKMGYIFENLIGRFYQNVDAGQFYTGRDIIKTLVSILISEGCDDIFDDHKVIKICDQACGTGGMLSTAYSYIKYYNPTADVRLFGQEFMGQSYAIGLAEMLIKGQNTDYFKHADTFKEDCFPNTKMRFVIENPPFGTKWSGDSAKEGQEDAVRKEHAKGKKGRWGAGLPSGDDSQLLFMQSAVDKMEDGIGRAAIISNGSPLFTGGTSSGESQIRRWLLEEDLIEAIIALPTDLFYNTGIATYAWILSKNKRKERINKIQLIDATSIYHNLRKSLGKKRKEISPKDRQTITNLYLNFEENDYCKILDKEDFLYREYTVMQPLQRSYAITEERIQNMISKGALSSLYDESKVYELENPTIKEEKETKKKKSKETIEKEKEKKRKKKETDKKKLQRYYDNKPKYDAVLKLLYENCEESIYYNQLDFKPIIEKLLDSLVDKKLIEKITDGLSVMDKNAEIHKDKKGNIIYDKETKDSEIVPYKQNIDDYMEKEVYPHVPDAKWFFEEELVKKDPVIKTGAEIPFTRYFYKYQTPTPSEELEKKFIELEKNVSERIANLFKN